MGLGKTLLMISLVLDSVNNEASSSDDSTNEKKSDNGKSKCWLLKINYFILLLLIYCYY